MLQSQKQKSFTITLKISCLNVVKIQSRRSIFNRPKKTWNQFKAALTNCDDIVVCTVSVIKQKDGARIRNSQSITTNAGQDVNKWAIYKR